MANLYASAVTIENLLSLVKNGIQVERFSVFERNNGHTQTSPNTRHELVNIKDVGEALTGSRDFVEKGMTGNLVSTSRAKFGSNEIPLPSIPTYLSLVLEALKDPTLRILLFSAVISLLFGMLKRKGNSEIEGISILATVVIVLNVQSFTNYSKGVEFRNQQVELENQKFVTVIRDGILIKIHPRDLVVGDVLRAKIGTVIPADGVLISGTLSMDESPLTGESRLIPKNTENIIVSGTNVMKGEGLVLILAVGKNSVQGNILQTIIDENEELTGSNTVLFKKLDSLAYNIGKIGMCCAIFVFCALFISWLFFCTDTKRIECLPTNTFVDNFAIILDFFIIGVTVIVVAVPEGLPLAVTLSLSIALSRLLQDNNQVKRIESCETMGSATTICSDKTGTLTENRMTVVYQSSFHEKHTELFLKCCVLAVSPESKLFYDDRSQIRYEGNPTECALLSYCKSQYHLDYKEFQMKYQDTEAAGLRWGSFVNPFSSKKKMMSVVIKEQITNITVGCRV